MSLPVGREGHARPSGLLRRLAAICYDTLLLAALLWVFTLVVVLLRGEAVAPGTWWFGPSLAAIAMVFFGWFWTHGGQTLGMRAWRLRVERADGTPLRWRDALTRWLAAWLSLLPAGLGYWWSLADAERRCWHDRLSGTRLVHEPPARDRKSKRRNRG